MRKGQHMEAVGWTFLGITCAVGMVYLVALIMTPPRHRRRDGKPGLKVGPGGRHIDLYL
jgi:hypothetical protein